MDLGGYGWTLVQGAAVTLQLGFAALAVAIGIGLLVALAKLGRVVPLRWLATAYTTVVRGIPELVLMLLIYYGGPTVLQHGIRSLGGQFSEFQLDFSPFLAGTITLGIIYGAYMAEVFRGAIQSIPPGQIEAGRAYGMTQTVLFRFVVLPQMMRFAVAGTGNVWLILLKATALASAIQLPELMRAAEIGAAATRTPFNFYLTAAAIYLGVTALSLLAVRQIERWAFRGEKRVTQ